MFWPPALKRYEKYWFLQAESFVSDLKILVDTKTKIRIEHWKLLCYVFVSVFNLDRSLNSKKL